jgi:hypothetical protein
VVSATGLDLPSHVIAAGVVMHPCYLIAGCQCPVTDNARRSTTGMGGCKRTSTDGSPVGSCRPQAVGDPCRPRGIKLD